MKLGRIIPVFLIATSVLESSAFASRWANQFVEFELPPLWECTLEGAEWVCQSTNETKKRDAIIVLAAKLKGDQDSLDQYRDYLQKPKSYVGLQGQAVKSVVKFTKDMQYNGQVWIDSLHSESEIPGFYTRYLATVYKDIGVLVTFSVNMNKYSQYFADLDNLVKTLKVFRRGGMGLNAKPTSGNLFDNTIPNSVSPDTVFPVAAASPASQTKPKKTEDDSGSMMPFLVIIGAVAYLIWRRKQRR